MKRDTRIGFQVTQKVNNQLERLPDSYNVSVTEVRKGDDPENCENEVHHLKESLEFGSFQQALQAFINRLE